MKTIVVASDLSAQSEPALHRAIALAAETHARVIVLLVREQSLSPESAAEGHARLRTDIATAPGAAQLAVTTEVISGKPWRVIPDFATQAGADLLVLGLHRKRMIFEVLRETTLERILRRASLPVLVARNAAARPYHTILAATEFAPSSAAALACAARIAPNADFYAIHALQVPLLPPRGISRKDAAEQALAEAEAARAEWRTYPGLPPALHTPEIIEGGVHQVVRFRLDELRPDLLTIGAQGPSGDDPAELGYFARDFIREPPCDLLIARG